MPPVFDRAELEQLTRKDLQSLCMDLRSLHGINIKANLRSSEIVDQLLEVDLRAPATQAESSAAAPPSAAQEEEQEEEEQHQQMPTSPSNRQLSTPSRLFLDLRLESVKKSLRQPAAAEEQLPPQHRDSDDADDSHVCRNLFGGLSDWEDDNDPPGLDDEAVDSISCSLEALEVVVTDLDLSTVVPADLEDAKEDPAEQPAVDGFAVPAFPTRLRLRGPASVNRPSIQQLLSPRLSFPQFSLHPRTPLPSAVRMGAARKTMARRSELVDQENQTPIVSQLQSSSPDDGGLGKTKMAQDDDGFVVPSLPAPGRIRVQLHHQQQDQSKQQINRKRTALARTPCAKANSKLAPRPGTPFKTPQLQQPMPPTADSLISTPLQKQKRQKMTKGAQPQYVHRRTPRPTGSRLL